MPERKQVLYRFLERERILKAKIGEREREALVVYTVWTDSPPVKEEEERDTHALRSVSAYLRWTNKIPAPIKTRHDSTTSFFFYLLPRHI